MEDVAASPEVFRASNCSQPPTPGDLSSMMTTFSTILSKGLAITAAQITSMIQAHNLGARIEIIEMKADQTIARTNQNTARIQELRDQLDTALSKIDDLENRSRCYNFRIRGLPEPIKEVDSVVCSLINVLITDIPEHRLEMDHAHRALQPPLVVYRETLWLNPPSTE